MREEIKKVLEMLDEKKITSEEAADLLDALKEAKKEEQYTPLNKRKRFLKIRVTKGKNLRSTLPYPLV